MKIKPMTAAGNRLFAKGRWIATLPVMATMLAPVGANSATDEAKPRAITDKTLVVWTSPANLPQRGGSALTIEKPGGVFDAIVFGEREPGRWMAGSNNAARTEKEQAGNATETAGEGMLIQIAIVYRGEQITLYRNGEQYADYAAGGAEKFGKDSFVLLGLRHLDAGAENRFYLGAIEDARIYDVALDADQIRALRPNQPSTPEPFAWWNFEDGRATDRMGAFPTGTLVGGAAISDGRLVLTGEGACLMASRLRPQDLLLHKGVDLANATARALREKLLSDPFRPGYHFVIPEGPGRPFDPNGAFFWKGRYHLFYIFQDERGHNWGHVSSTDLFHWRHHPTRLVSGMFSGNCFINKDGRPTMCYHQVGQGNAMAVALDEELNEWEKLDTNPITPETQEGDSHHGKYQSWDPYGWIEDGSYYAIFGGKRPAIAKAPTLGGKWEYVGDLLANTVGDISINEDVSCADFFTIGDKRMLLCISHDLGARYYLGEWKDEQFHPDFHEKMSWVDNSYFAPESLIDDHGRRIMWAWIFDHPGFQPRMYYGWSGTMSLPRVLTLGDDGMLRMNPPEEIERLRYNARTVPSVVIAADGEARLEGIAGASLELSIELRAEGATQYGVKVCCSEDGEEETAIYFDAAEKALKVDTTKSSITEGAKTVEAGPLQLARGEALDLRVFIDKSVVEVFANGRQAVMRRIYPSRPDSTGVVLFSQGGPTRATHIDAWEMMPSNPY